MCITMATNSCNYTLTPLTDIFGAKVDGIVLNEIDQECAEKMKEEAYMFRFLLFRDQDFSWQDQVKFTKTLGKPFEEGSSINRKTHKKIPDRHLGYFSNDPEEGVTGVGIEGWHVDGNVAPMPHMFTMIYCVHSNKGPTLIVPLKEIVHQLSDEDRNRLEKISFVSGHNASIIQPLLYKEQHRNDDTIMLALGKLSGQYLQKKDVKSEPRKLSVEETKAIQDLLQLKILSSNKIYTQQYRPKDLLLLYNPAVAHLAGPGSQTSRAISGLRLMRRSTVLGSKMPSKVSNIEYECAKLSPFESGYCLFSLKGSVYYPRPGVFDNQKSARKHCRRINKHADLAVLPTVEWNEFARDIITCKGVPHWLNARNPEGQDVYWNGHLQGKSEFTLWDSASQQPNDCDGSEECVIIGPYGHWFDFSCGPKTKEGSDPGPVMTWENGERKMFNIYPLCGVEFKHLSDQDNKKWR